MNQVTPSSALDSGATPWTPKTAIPNSLRELGRVPDFEKWHPGDVILFRPKNPDRVSREIRDVQALGYGEDFASYTHTAVYLGDEIMLCEAQFDPLKGLFGVIIAQLSAYLSGYDLLVKRSRHASTKELGWAIATATASRIGDSYDWKFALKLAADRRFVGEKVWLKDQTAKITSKALVCSSLYSTAHAYVTDVSITDKLNGLCVPAYLAGENKHLQNVAFDWSPIA